MKKLFFFFFYGENEKGKPKKRERVPVDYDLLYARLLEGPVTFAEIEQLSGVAHSGVAQVITTLSIRYPVWSPKRGLYKLLEESDYE